MMGRWVSKSMDRSVGDLSDWQAALHKFIFKELNERQGPRLYQYPSPANFILLQSASKID